MNGFKYSICALLLHFAMASIFLIEYEVQRLRKMKTFQKADYELTIMPNERVEKSLRLRRED